MVDVSGRFTKAVRRSSLIRVILLAILAVLISMPAKATSASEIRETALRTLVELYSSEWQTCAWSSNVPSSVYDFPQHILEHMDQDPDFLGSYEQGIFQRAAQSYGMRTIREWLTAIEWFPATARSGGYMTDCFPYKRDPFTFSLFDHRGFRTGEPFVYRGEFERPLPQIGRDREYGLSLPRVMEPEHPEATAGRLLLTNTGDALLLRKSDARARALVERMRLFGVHLQDFESPSLRTLGRLARHQDYLLRREAVIALHRLDDPRALKYLQSLTRDPEPEIRFLAAIACAALGDASGEMVLRSAAKETVLHRSIQESRTYYAYCALGTLGFVDVRSQLEGYAKVWMDFRMQSDPELPSELAEALGRVE